MQCGRAYDLFAPIPMVLWLIGSALMGFRDPFVHSHFLIQISYLLAFVLIISGLFFFKKSPVKPDGLSLLLVVWPFGIYWAFVFHLILTFPGFLALWLGGFLFFSYQWFQQVVRHDNSSE